MTQLDCGICGTSSDWAEFYQEDDTFADPLICPACDVVFRGWPSNKPVPDGWYRFNERVIIKYEQIEPLENKESPI